MTHSKPRHLLLFSYFWPPFGGAGVQRALKLAQAAPQFGWRVSVVAGKPRPTDSQDPSLLTEDVASIPVMRADHLRVGGRLWRLRSWMPPDPYLLWRDPALAAARAMIAKDPPDALMSTSMPYTSHLVAAEIKALLEVPWLADLRDPWTDNRFHLYFHGDNLRARWRRWIDQRMEQQTYDQADLLSVTSAGLQDILVDKWQLPRDRVILARNGYDEADFAGVLPLPGADSPTIGRAEDQQRPMRVLFAGSMYAGYTIEAFFAAWQRLLEQREDVQIELVAHTQSASMLQKLCAQYPLAGAHTTTGPRVSHDEVIRLYGQADLLVLATLDDRSIPGKLFEYIRSGTPVLAFACDGAESWALLSQTGTGTAVAHDDVAAGAAALESMYEAWSAGAAMTQPDPQSVAALERKVAYAKLFAALDQRV